MIHNNGLKTDIHQKIVNCLIENSVITNPRIIRCGNWFNKKIRGNIKKVRFFCYKWECRVCRSKIIASINNKHLDYNNSFYYNGGTFLIINLTVPKFPASKSFDYMIQFKKSLIKLKESRFWEKLKIITKGQYHYDNIEIIYSKKEYQLYNNILYGKFENNIERDNLETQLFSYWSKITKSYGFKNISRNYSQIHFFKTNYNSIINNIDIPSLTLINKDITQRTTVLGSLENIENNFYITHTQPKTNLKSVEYLKQKSLSDISINIKNINLMQIKLKHGRIWKMNK